LLAYRSYFHIFTPGTYTLLILIAKKCSPHHPHTILPHESQEDKAKLSEAQTLEAVRKQVEYYFSAENLRQDAFLRSQMDAESSCSIDVIMKFAKIKALTGDNSVVESALEGSYVVSITEQGRIKASAPLKAMGPARTTIILRDIPRDAPEEEVREIFAYENCKPIVSLRADLGDTWFVVMENEEDAADTLLELKNRRRVFRDSPVKGRVKSEPIARSFFPVQPIAPGAMPGGPGGAVGVSGMPFSPMAFTPSPYGVGPNGASFFAPDPSQIRGAAGGVGVLNDGQRGGLKETRSVGVGGSREGKRYADKGSGSPTAYVSSGTMAGGVGANATLNMRGKQRQADQQMQAQSQMQQQIRRQQESQQQGLRDQGGRPAGSSSSSGGGSAGLSVAADTIGGSGIASSVVTSRDGASSARDSTRQGGNGSGTTQFKENGRNGRGARGGRSERGGAGAGKMSSAPPIDFSAMDFPALSDGSDTHNPSSSSSSSSSSMSASVDFKSVAVGGLSSVYLQSSSTQTQMGTAQMASSGAQTLQSESKTNTSVGVSNGTAAAAGAPAIGTDGSAAVVAAGAAVDAVVDAAVAAGAAAQAKAAVVAKEAGIGAAAAAAGGSGSGSGGGGGGSWVAIAKSAWGGSDISNGPMTIPLASKLYASPKGTPSPGSHSHSGGGTRTNQGGADGSGGKGAGASPGSNNRGAGTGAGGSGDKRDRVKGRTRDVRSGEAAGGGARGAAAGSGGETGSRRRGDGSRSAAVGASFTTSICLSVCLSVCLPLSKKKCASATTRSLITFSEPKELFHSAQVALDWASRC
jgi:hypothetical protein